MEIPPDSHLRPLSSITPNNKVSESSSPTRHDMALNQQPNTQPDSPIKSPAAEDEPKKVEFDDAWAEKLAMFFQNVNRELKFKVDNEGGDPIVFIIDKASGEVIRQVPAQELLDINESLAKYPPVSLSQKV